MKKAIENLPDIVKLILAVVLLVFVYTFIKRAYAWLQIKNSSFELNQESALFQGQGQTLSYPPTQYGTFANTLHNAHGYINDDEVAILSVFRRLQNDLDVLELEKKYRANHGATIADFLNSVFNRTEIADVNAILASNNILRRY